MVVYDKKDGVNKKTQVFTPELWRFVCLIFGRDMYVNLPKFLLEVWWSDQGWSLTLHENHVLWRRRVKSIITRCLSGLNYSSMLINSNIIGCFSITLSQSPEQFYFFQLNHLRFVRYFLRLILWLCLNIIDPCNFGNHFSYICVW